MVLFLELAAVYAVHPLREIGVLGFWASFMVLVFIVMGFWVSDDGA
jgi:hypothetical protein